MIKGKWLVQQNSEWRCSNCGGIKLPYDSNNYCAVCNDEKNEVVAPVIVKKESNQCGSYRGYTNAKELSDGLDELTNMLLETIHEHGTPHNLQWIAKDKYLNMKEYSTIGWKADFYD